MGSLPEKIKNRLAKRQTDNTLRKLLLIQEQVDFTSNDYLGFAGSRELHAETLKFLEERANFNNGSTGSRLLSGNNKLFEETESFLAEYHKCEAALIFNSGYDANLGFFSSVPQRGDLLLYDEYVHASIRDGISASNAVSYRFKHNDLQDLENVLDRYRQRKHKDRSDAVYVVTESVFSMDGDVPDLKFLTEFCLQQHCYLIVDEAHAFGLFGDTGGGLIEQLGVAEKVFARIITFGKALGSHGAAVLGSNELKEYLVNFARSFIYTTALSPHAIAAILVGHKYLNSEEGVRARNQLNANVAYFQNKILDFKLESFFLASQSAIHSCLVRGNLHARKVSGILRKDGFDVRAILSPTVPQDMERLRFCLHSFNTKEQIDSVLKLLALSLDER